MLQVTVNNVADVFFMLFAYFNTYFAWFSFPR